MSTDETFDESVSSDFDSSSNECLSMGLAGAGATQQKNEHIFDPKTKSGFVECRLKTVRTRLQPSEKKYTKKKNKATKMKGPLDYLDTTEVECILDGIEQNGHNEWTRSQTRSERMRSKIKKELRDVYYNRSEEMGSGDYACSVSSKYPSLSDFNGELVMDSGEEVEITKFCDLDPSTLKEVLISNKISETAAKVLEDEEINGEVFLTLKESDLMSLNLKMGPRKMILNLITKFSQLNEEVLTPIVNLPKKEMFYETLHFDSSRDHFSVGLEGPSQPNPSVGLEGPSLPNPSVGLKCLSQPNPEKVTTQNADLYDVKKILCSHSEGEEIVRTILATNSLPLDKRRLMIRILVGKLTEDACSCYPSTELKKKMAKSITEAFPCLRSKRTPKGYEHFFDPINKTGFIEFRLKTVRVRLAPSRKKYKLKKEKAVSDNSDTRSNEACQYGCSCVECTIDRGEQNKLINWMKSEALSEGNRLEIENALMETHKGRREEIANGATAGAILLKYPRLLDFNGDMINHEFSMLCDTDHLGLLSSFPDLSNKIMQYVQANRSDIIPKLWDFKDENMKAVLALTILLPSRGRRTKKDSTKQKTKPHKVDNSFPPKQLVVFKPEGSDVLDDYKGGDSQNLMQAFLICIGDSFSGNYFLNIDNKIVAIGSSFLKAFDILFKSHFVFNLQYAFDLALFFNFFECFVYNMKHSSPKTSAAALEVCLSQ